MITYRKVCMFRMKKMACHLNCIVTVVYSKHGISLKSLDYVDLLGNKHPLNIGRFPEVRTAGRTSHLDNEKCFVFDITPYSLRDRAMKLKHQKML